MRQRGKHQLISDAEREKNKFVTTGLLFTGCHFLKKMDLGLDDFLDIINLEEDEMPTQSYHIFDWKTTETALKLFDSKVKASGEAKEGFACTMSSIADEIMDHMLRNDSNKHIDEIDVKKAFESIDAPIETSKLSNDRMSLRRLLQKHRTLKPRFTIAPGAKKLLACALYSL